MCWTSPSHPPSHPPCLLLLLLPLLLPPLQNDGEKIKRNLQQQARAAQWLVLWLDCDREGENIAFEVIAVCREANPRLVIKRARFSGGLCWWVGRWVGLVGG